MVGAHGLGCWRLHSDIIYLPGVGKQKTTQKTSNRMIHLSDRHEISGSKKRKFAACFILFCCVPVSFDCNSLLLEDLIFTLQLAVLCGHQDRSLPVT